MASINTSTMSEALKRVYTGWLVHCLNNSFLPLKRIQRVTKKVKIHGSKLYFSVHFGDGGSVRAGTETGTLPTAEAPQLQQASEDIAHFFGTREWADAYIDRAQEDIAAFSHETEAGIKTLKDEMMYHVARSVMGNGDGIITTLRAASDGASATLKVVDASKFRIGIKLDVVHGAAYTTRITAGSYMKVTGIDRDDNNISCSTGTTASTAAGDYIIVYKAHAAGTSHETKGVEQFCSKTATLHGLDVATYPWWKGTVVKNGDSDEVIHFNKIHKLIDSIVDEGGYPSVMYCTSAVRRTIMDLLQSRQHYVDSLTLDGGGKVDAFTGAGGPIPIISDRFAPAGTLLALSEKDLGWSNLGTPGPKWLQRDGSILHLKADTPVYQAVLAWYCQFLCFKRNVQGKLTNIEEDVL